MKRFLHVLFGLLISVLPLAAQELQNGSPVYVLEIINGVPYLTGTTSGGGSGPSTDTLSTILGRGNDATGLGMINLGALLPTGDLTQDLGSPTHQWRSIYVGGHTIYMDNVPMFTVTNNEMVVAYPVVTSNNVSYLTTSSGANVHSNNTYDAGTMQTMDSITVSNLYVRTLLQMFGYAITNIDTNAVLYADGSQPLTADWNVSAHGLTNISYLFNTNGVRFALTTDLPTTPSLQAVTTVGNTTSNGLVVKNSGNYTNCAIQSIPTLASQDVMILGENAGSTLTTPNGLTVVGRNAGQYLTDASYSTVLGVEAMRYAAHGHINVVVGHQALMYNTNGTYNTAVGAGAGKNLLSGDDNCLIGPNNFADGIQGSQNTAVGSTALRNLRYGNDNVAIGYEAIRQTYSNSYGNVGVGRDALQTLGAFGVTPMQSYNIGIGYYAGSNLTNGQGNIYLGANSQASAQTATNEFVAGSSTYPIRNVYFGGGAGSVIPWTLHGEAATVNVSNLVIGAGGSVLPAVSNNVDLGSATQPFRKLYVTGATIYMDNIPMFTITNNQLQVGLPMVTTNTTVTYLTSTNGVALNSNNTGNLILTSTGVGIGSTNLSLAKVYVNGEAGAYTNKPLVLLNRSATATGNILEWDVNGTQVGYVDVNGQLVTPQLSANNASFVTSSVSQSLSLFGTAFTGVDTNIALYANGSQAYLGTQNAGGFGITNLGSCLPGTSNTVDLGSAAFPWRFLYLDGQVVSPSAIQTWNNAVTNGQSAVSIALNTPTGTTNTFNGVVKLATNAIAWDDMLGPALIFTTGGVDINTDDTLAGKSFLTSAVTNQANDHLTCVYQTPHRRKSGTALKPHIHFWQTNADQTNCWYAFYSWVGIGQTNVSEVQIGPAVNEMPYTSGTMHQLASFPDLPDTGQGISSILRFKLYRFGSRGTGAITVTDIDLHYQIDSLGSDAPTSKSF